MAGSGAEAVQAASTSSVLAEAKLMLAQRQKALADRNSTMLAEVRPHAALMPKCIVFASFGEQHPLRMLVQRCGDVLLPGGHSLARPSLQRRV